MNLLVVGRQLTERIILPALAAGKLSSQTGTFLTSEGLIGDKTEGGG
jgi:hypothetical protein